MVGFAALFCQVYPQMYFPHSFGSEELEAYSLQLGLMTHELLRLSDRRAEDDGLAGDSQTFLDSDMGSPSRRLTADNHDFNGDEEDGDPLQGDQAASMALEQERAGPIQQTAHPGKPDEVLSSDMSVADSGIEQEGSSTPPREPAVDATPEPPVDASPAMHAAEVEAYPDALIHATDVSTVSPAAAVEQAPETAADAFPSVVEKAHGVPVRQQRLEGGGSVAPQDTADHLTIAKLQQELESQRIQQRQLLKHIADQQRLIQEKQAQTLHLHQQSPTPHSHLPEGRGIIVEHSSLRTQGSANSFQEASIHDKTDMHLGVDRWHVERPGLVTFPGINAPHEGDQATIERILFHERQIARDEALHMPVVEDESESTRLRQKLEERYGPLFLSLASFLLKDSVLDDLIRVAEWHLEPSAHGHLCKEPKFSLFSLSREEGQRHRCFSCLYCCREIHHDQNLCSLRDLPGNC